MKCELHKNMICDFCLIVVPLLLSVIKAPLSLNKGLSGGHQ